MLTETTLKNININVFEDFFKEHKVKNRTIRIKALNTPSKYSLILNLIKEELESKESFTKEQLEDLIFEQLYYNNNNHHYMYKFNGFFFKRSTPFEEVVGYLANQTELFFNSIIDNVLNLTRNFNICTTRIEKDKLGTVKAVHILIRISTERLKYGETHVFAGVMLDMDSGFVLIKFGFNEFSEIDEEPLKIIENIRNFLNGQGISGKVAVPLGLNIISLNEQEPKEAIFQMFEEMSKEAEAILNEKVSPETEQKINHFLTSELKLKHINKEYYEQIKAVIFQDISNDITPSLFKNGWVFRFNYQEGDHTRATSKQQDRGPVYGSKTFWQLKELIYKEQEMLEAGFHWYLKDYTQKDQFVDVRLTAQNDTMIVHHYSNTRLDRKEKEEFVLRKIAGYLS